MRLPLRRSERLKIHTDDGPFRITADGLKKLISKLKHIESTDLPESILDVQRTAEFGDFSENAEYQEAKARMRRLHAQIFSLKEKIKQADVIESNVVSDGTVQLGSTVLLETKGMQKTFFIVGSHEANPIQGRISHLSPLGVRLIGHKIGDQINVPTSQGEILYLIKNILI